MAAKERHATRVHLIAAEIAPFHLVPVAGDHRVQHFSPAVDAVDVAGPQGCRRDLCWNLLRRGVRLGEDIGSGSEVNWLVSEPLGESLPSVDFAHRDLTGREQRPKQHGCGLGRGQHRLGFYPTLELLMEPFDRVGGACALPLAAGQPGKGEEPVAGFLEAVGYRLAS